MSLKIQRYKTLAHRTFWLHLFYYILGDNNKLARARLMGPVSL